MPHAKAATKLFAKIVAAAGSKDVLTADGLAERLIAFGVPEERSWRLFDLLDDDGDDEVTLDEFVRGFAHYTALVNEFTAENGSLTELGIEQLPQECMASVLSYLSPGSPAGLLDVARASSRLNAAAAADDVWAPMFRHRPWVAPLHRQLSAQLNQMKVSETGWNTVVQALPSAVRNQLSRWHSWRECYRGALRQESWVVVEIAAAELRIGSLADPSPIMLPLPSPVLRVLGAECSSDLGGGGKQWSSRMASGAIVADLICEALGRAGLGSGISADGVSLCVVISPLDSPTMLHELAEALAEHKVHRLQFINLTVAALECARASTRENGSLHGFVEERLTGKPSQNDESPPPSGIVVIIGDEGCYAAAVANGHQLHVPTPSPSSDAKCAGFLGSKGFRVPATQEARQTRTAVATASFLPPITSSGEVVGVKGTRSQISRPASRSAAGRGRTATKAQQQAQELQEEHRALEAAAVPSTLSVYGCAALARDLAAAVADAVQSAGNPGLQGSAEVQQLQASDILLGIRSQLTSICYVRACPASARPVSEEEKRLCRAAYEIPFRPSEFSYSEITTKNGGGDSSSGTGCSGSSDNNSSTNTGSAIRKTGSSTLAATVNWPAQLQPMGAAAASSLVRQARLQQLRVRASANGSANGIRAAHVSASGGPGSSIRRGIARFSDASDTARVGSRIHADTAGDPGILAVLVKPQQQQAPSPHSKALPEQRQQQERCPSVVIELGEQRFALTEALLYGCGHRYGHASGPVEAAARGGSAGVIGALWNLAESIFGVGSSCGSGRSLHNSDQLAALTTARQLVLAGEGALLQGLCSRIGWELRQRDASRTAPIGRMLRSAKMVAVTRPRPQIERRRRGHRQAVDDQNHGNGGPDAQVNRTAEQASAAAVPGQPDASLRQALHAATQETAEEARAVGWYGGKIHALRVERTGGFLKKGASGSADAMRMASGRAWLTLNAKLADNGGANDGETRRLMQPNQLAEQLKLHLRHRAGFPMPTSTRA